MGTNLADGPELVTRGVDGQPGHADPETDDEACGRVAGDADHHAICGLVRVGVVVVAAAGNEEADFSPLGPATYREVLAVTAMADRDGQPGGLGGAFNCDPAQFDDDVAYWSNFTTQPADTTHVVAAPGVCMPSTFPGSWYAVGSGTSFATPVVAGTVALCIAAGPCAGLTPPQVIAKIVADAEAYNLAHPEYGYDGDPLRPIDDRHYGYLINASLY